jgi:hypothetical protein
MERVKQGILLRWAVAGLVLVGLAMLPVANSAFADDSNHDSSHNAPTFNVHSLHGRYISAGNSGDASITDSDGDDDAPARAFVAAGFLNFDGKGNIPSGEETINYGVPGSGDSFTCELSGTYTVDSATGRAILTLTATGGPAVTPGETTALNNSQCGGTSTVVGYIGGPNGKELATVEQTVVPGTPPTGVAADTPILSAHIWKRQAGFGH